MKKRITHVPNHSFIIILNYQNQFIRILIYQNQSKKKKKKRENTHVSLVNLPNRVQICLFPKLGRLVPEFGELGYCVKYPSTLNSGTNLPNFGK